MADASPGVSYDSTPYVYVVDAERPESRYELRDVVDTRVDGVQDDPVHLKILYPWRPGPPTSVLVDHEREIWDVPYVTSARPVGVDGGVESIAIDVVAVALPLDAVTLIVYMVVEVGDTTIDPESVDVDTDPGEIVMAGDVPAPIMFQESVDVAPSTIIEGAGENDTIEGGAIVTVTVDVVVPLALVAVSVYTVVEVGATTIDPESVDVDTDPGEIVMAVAVGEATFQESVVVAPYWIVALAAAKKVMPGDDDASEKNDAIIAVMPNCVVVAPPKVLEYVPVAFTISSAIARLAWLFCGIIISIVHPADTVVDAAGGVGVNENSSSFWAIVVTFPVLIERALALL